MLANALALERCLRQLVMQGKKYGGCVTYQLIIDTLHDKQCNVSMETLDWIYERLAAVGIELVDQLRCSPVMDVEEQDNGGSIPEHRRRAEAARRKRRYSCNDHSIKSLGRTESALCPEEAVDRLLLRWHATGLILEEDLLTSKTVVFLR